MVSIHPKGRRAACLMLAFLTAATCPGQSKLREGRANWDQFQVHYFYSGSGQEGVVYIHGWSCDHSFWRAQGPAVRRFYSVLVDLPGHGASSKPETAYTQEAFAQSVIATMVAAGMRRAVLVGHSMGGPVALNVLRLRPELVKGIVFVDSVLPMPARSPEEEQKQKAQWKAMLDGFRTGDYKAEMAKAVARMAGENLAAAIRDEITQKMQATPKHVGISAFSELSSLQPVERTWPGVPVLVLQAKRADSQRYQEYLRARFPRLEFMEFPGAGHFLMLEQPEQVNPPLIAFLERVLKR